MAVANDGSGTNNTNANAVTSLNLTTFTVGSGSNRALIGILVFGVAAGALPTAVSMTWNGVSLTQVLTVANTTGTSRIEFWRLINPATGNFTLAASWTGSSDVVLGSVEFSGVNQTTPIVTVDNTPATGTGTAITATVPSAANDATVAVAGNSLNNITVSNQTVLFTNNLATNVGSGASYALGGTSNIHNFTLAVSHEWEEAGIHVQAAPSVGGTYLLYAGTR